MGINFTDIATADPVIAATFNDRLDELDTAIKKNVYAGTAAPTTGDDSADGYTVGTRWIDTTNDRMYVLVDATVGAAIWLELGSAGMVQRLPAMSFYSVGVGSPIQGILASRTPTWLLDAAATELVGATFEYTGWKSGANMTLTAFWAMESATSGNVFIVGRASAIGDGEDLNSVATEVVNNQVVAVPGTAKLMKKTAYSLVNVNYAPGDLIRISFSRTGGDASDTATGDLHFLGLTARFL